MITDVDKVTLDLVHLDKILNSEGIVVIDVDGYTGFSTKREIQWARMQDKSVYWITPPELDHEKPGEDNWAGELL